MLLWWCYEMSFYWIFYFITTDRLYYSDMSCRVCRIARCCLDHVLQRQLFMRFKVAMVKSTLYEQNYKNNWYKCRFALKSAIKSHIVGRWMSTVPVVSILGLQNTTTWHLPVLSWSLYVLRTMITRSALVLLHSFTSAERVLNVQVLEKIYLPCRRRYTYLAKEVYPLWEVSSTNMMGAVYLVRTALMKNVRFFIFANIINVQTLQFQI